VEKRIAPDGVGNRIADDNLAFDDFVGTKVSLGSGAINAIFFINNFNDAFVFRNGLNRNPISTHKIFWNYIALFRNFHFFPLTLGYTEYTKIRDRRPHL